MCFRMRQIEASAEGMTELVMQNHPNMTQYRTTQPGTVKAIAARSEIFRIALETSHACRQRAYSFFGHE
ncbi:hypothetical protein WM22_09930 [Burkholderia ubonensis]|nr:hypothetical protein WM20_29600 [Burkholderia ubonensis]KWN39312.1 hypothetical protein WM22_09930 [Burkholderia ubonensis]